MADQRERPTIKPFQDADKEPPVPAGEPSRTTEEAARRDMAIRGAAAGGAQSGAAGYAGGAMTGTGGAIGMRLVDAEGSDGDPLDSPEGDAQLSTGPADTPGIDEPVGPTEVAGPDTPDR